MEDRFRPWIERDNPRMAFTVAAGLIAGSQVPVAEQNRAALMREEARTPALSAATRTILRLPTTPFPAPLRGLPMPVLRPMRDRIACLCAQGGLAGHPQVNLPGALIYGAPIGLSVIGARGSDASLIAVAQALETASS